MHKTRERLAVVDGEIIVLVVWCLKKNLRYRRWDIGGMFVFGLAGVFIGYKSLLAKQEQWAYILMHFSQSFRSLRSIRRTQLAQPELQRNNPVATDALNL